MKAAKEKVSNAASVAKEHAQIYKAQVEEKVEKSAARTHEEKVIAQERRKAKEAEAKMVMHQEKAEHAAEKLQGKHHYHEPLVGGQGHHILPHQPAVGAVDPMTGTTAAPLYPPGGHHHLPHQPVAGVVDPAYPAGGQLAGHHNKYV